MILIGDCLERLKELNENSVDAIVTDPPYGLKFMNKGWDYDVPSIETWRAVFRVLKPGGHLLSFGGTRTYHRMVVSIEDAGFEIRDQIQWLYGSGFPKSLDISKAIDKKFGAKREVIGTVEHDIRNGSLIGKSGKVETQITKPSTPEAYRYKGWGTALKPANEPICLARKPLEKGLTVAENVLKWGVGGLNIDESRIGNDVTGWEGRANKRFEFSGDGKHQPEQMNAGEARPVQGRWPSNVILGCDCEGAEHGQLCAVQMLDEQSGVAKPKARREGKRGGNGFGFFDDDKSANENGVGRKMLAAAHPAFSMWRKHQSVNAMQA